MDFVWELVTMVFLLCGPIPFDCTLPAHPGLSISHHISLSLINAKDPTYIHDLVSLARPAEGFCWIASYFGNGNPHPHDIPPEKLGSDTVWWCLVTTVTSQMLWNKPPNSLHYSQCCDQIWNIFSVIWSFFPLVPYSVTPWRWFTWMQGTQHVHITAKELQIQTTPIF